MWTGSMFSFSKNMAPKPFCTFGLYSCRNNDDWPRQLWRISAFKQYCPKFFLQCLSDNIWRIKFRNVYFQIVRCHWNWYKPAKHSFANVLRIKIRKTNSVILEPSYTTDIESKQPGTSTLMCNMSNADESITVSKISVFDSVPAPDEVSNDCVEETSHSDSVQVSGNISNKLDGKFLTTDRLIETLTN